MKGKAPTSWLSITKVIAKGDFNPKAEGVGFKGSNLMMTIFY